MKHVESCYIVKNTVVPTKRVIAFIVCTCYKAQHDITPENIEQFIIYCTSTHESLAADAVTLKV